MPKPPAAFIAPPSKRRFRFFRAHKILTALLVFLFVGAAVGLAAVLWSQDLTATPNTRTSPVVFAAGDDAVSLDALDFIGASDPVISADGAAASFTVYGIPGATSLSLGEVVELQNPDTADNTAYVVTLSVAGTPEDSLTAFVVTFFDDVGGTPTLRTWDLLSTPELTAYTLGDAETWEFTVSSLTISASITPA